MTELKTMHRRVDPETSRMAAEDITNDGTATALRRQVAYAVHSNPGLTSRELAESGTELSHENFHKRLPELERNGKVHRAQARKCRVTGRTATTWHPGPEGDPEQLDLI